MPYAARIFAAAALTASIPLLISAGQDATLNAGLLRSIRAGDTSGVENLLRHGADINAREEHGATALMYAALYSPAQCMRLLLEKGADPNAKNKFGATALMWGADDAVKVRMLISKGADVNARATSGRTALMAAAAARGAADAVEALIEAGADVKARDSMNRGAVSSAAEAGDASILRQLLAKGADPNEPTQFGSALMSAAFLGNLEAVNLLVARGANVNFKSEPRPPVKAGLQDLGELTALMAAAANGHSDTVKALLKAGATVNTKDMRGMTPLLLAVTAESQDIESVQALLAKGADVKAKDNSGRSALAWARLWGETPIVKLLHNAGAKDDDTSVAADQVAGTAADFPSAREAVEKSLALLQTSGAQFFEKSGCGSCHHQYLTGTLVGLAREKGLRVNEKLAGESIKQAMVAPTGSRELMLQHRGNPGSPVVDTALLVSLADQHYAPSEITDALVHQLCGFQQEDGGWISLVNRPPITSRISETARIIRALQAYAPEGRRAGIVDRVQRARAWLLAVTPQVTEERAMQLLGLYWSGMGPAELKNPARQLIQIQQDDGGWGQRPGFPSDAYATGEALYSLHQASALPISDPVYRRGVEFLRRTQFDDGSWLVKSRSVKFQPYFQSGFPHGHDQWISAAGTAWAAMALALTVGPDAPGPRGN